HLQLSAVIQGRPKAAREDRVLRPVHVQTLITRRESCPWLPGALRRTFCWRLVPQPRSAPAVVAPIASPRLAKARSRLHRLRPPVRRPHRPRRRTRRPPATARTASTTSAPWPARPTAACPARS